MSFKGKPVRVIVTGNAREVFDGGIIRLGSQLVDKIKYLENRCNLFGWAIMGLYVILAVYIFHNSQRNRLK